MPWLVPLHRVDPLRPSSISPSLEIGARQIERKGVLVSKKSWIRYIATVGLLAAASMSCRAALLDFEAGFEVVDPDGIYVEAGFRLSPSGGGAMVAPSFCDPFSEFCATGNLTSYMTVFNDAQLTITSETGALFSLVGFEASFFPTPLINFSGEDTWLRLVGMTSSGSVTQMVRLVEDALAPGNFVFSDYVAAPGMVELASLTIGACFFDGTTCSGLLANDAQFAIDDIVLGQTEIPEPSAILLLGIALTGLAASRRRLRQSSKPT